MTKSQLFSLPNELLLHIFQYLTSIEILTAFIDFQYVRIERLLQSHLSFLDISQETIKWIDMYLPRALRDYKISALRLNDKQINAVLKYLSLGNVQSMQVMNMDSTDPIPDQDLLPLRQCLEKLTIEVLCPIRRKITIDESYENRKIILFPYFRYSGRFFHRRNVSNGNWPYLTHLSIDLDTIHDLFIVLGCLSSLEHLKVNFCHSCSYAHDKPRIDLKKLKISKTIYRVAMSGISEYSSAFKKFFAICGSMIESFRLNINFLSTELSGSILEHDLLNEMPRLSSLDLLIKCDRSHIYQSNTIHRIAIEQFQTPAWQKFHPIVCWHDEICGCQNIFTLPYNDRHFEIHSNKFTFLSAVRPSVPLRFERVRSLSMISKYPRWTMETFRFIQQTFPHLQTLRLNSKFSEWDFQFDEDILDERYPEIFDKDFSSDAALQLPSVTKLSLEIESKQYNQPTLHCLFHLLPNLTNIETDNHPFFCDYMQSGGHYVDSIINSLPYSTLSSYTMRTDPFLTYNHASNYCIN